MGTLTMIDENNTVYVHNHYYMTRYQWIILSSSWRKNQQRGDVRSISRASSSDSLFGRARICGAMASISSASSPGGVTHEVRWGPRNERPSSVEQCECSR